MGWIAMKRNRILGAALLLLACLCACAPQAAVPEPPAERPVLDWYVNYSWFTAKWGDSLVARAISDAVGVEINLLHPTGSESEKLSSMIASGTLPDLITLSYELPQVREMIENGQVHSLGELADAHAPEFWQAARKPQLQWYTMEDGRIYAYPNSSYTPRDYEVHDNIGSNQTFLVRKDLYEAIGSPDMTTPEGFQAAVREAAARFPTVDGQPLIPVGAHEFTETGCDSFDKYLMNFLAVPFEREGAVYDRTTDPDYLRWLKALRNLWEEGLLADEIFVDKRVQVMEKTAQGRYFCMLYQRTDVADQQKLLYQQDPDRIYIAVDGPRNSRGDDHTLPGAGISGWTVTMIPNACKAPDAAIRLMSYLISEEGQKMIYLGVEGETYEIRDGKPALLPEVRELLARDRTEFNRLYSADNTYWMLQDNIRQLQWATPLEPPLAQPETWTYPYTIYTAHYDIEFPYGSSEANTQRKLERLWGETLPRLLTAESDAAFDRLLDDYLQRREELDYPWILEQSTIRMNRNKEQLARLPIP